MATEATVAAGRYADLVHTLDRDGQPLARTIDSWTVALQPAKVIGDKKALSVELSRLMPEKDAAGWQAEINSGKSFVYLRRRAAPRFTITDELYCIESFCHAAASATAGAA